MTNVLSVFVVDDDDSARRGLTRLLRTANYDVRDFASSNEFLEALDSEMPGCVVMDAGSPGLSPEQLEAELNARDELVPIIIVTTHDDSETKRTAEKLNAVGFFRKPVDGTALLDAVNWALRSSSTDGMRETN